MAQQFRVVDKLESKNGRIGRTLYTFDWTSESEARDHLAETIRRYRRQNVPFNSDHIGIHVAGRVRLLESRDC